MSKEYDYDIIIVGSGALGANVARVLAERNHSVAILEAGEKIPRWKILENFRNSPRKGNLNSPYPNAPWARHSFDDDYIENTGSFEFKPGMLKLVGGTTWHWAAFTWRYLPNDMKINTLYGVGRDWPIEYDDLEPFYTKAEYALGVAGNDTQDQSGHNQGPFPPRSKPYPLPPEQDNYLLQRVRDRLSPLGYRFVHEPCARATVKFENRPACAGNNNCMPICPIGAMYSGISDVEKAEKAGAILLTDATAYRINRGKENKIESIDYRSSKGEDKQLTAKYFVIAAHGLETPKLLLMSDVANSSDQVGRNLMDHSGAGLQFIADEEVWPGRGSIEYGVIVNHRDGDFRKKHAAMRHGFTNSNPNLTLTQNLIEQGYLGTELDEKIRYQASRWVDISTVFEMLPDPNNTVRPSTTRKDALGIPMLTVHYNVADYVKNAREVAYQDYAKIVAEMGEKVIVDRTGFQNRDHLMGTVIMGDNPKDSVVNHECRTWDHPNLFLATTGVIPASGVVNPTLTGVALSIRLAEIIDREI
ncbi:GMC family oxidoreductase [Ignatzschineria larvae DSM 13226]|uniref:GMC family oxidoreductase n=1 Tax=Ignatzschineria larvae DSM 13226 TaxID=1111732 RepID=A0ABZ3C002_9GAMM|nr:GMC family oxidoreductase [Ignatzschineria larvae]